MQIDVTQAEVIFILLWPGGLREKRMVFVAYSGSVARVKEESSPSQGVHTRVTRSAKRESGALEEHFEEQGGKGKVVL
jgi:hypothetical protein